MTLTEPQNAIDNCVGWGPAFGRGHDLVVYNKHPTDDKGIGDSRFPTSFNNNGKYQKTQQTYTMFQGNPNGPSFLVPEYEVFVVLK